MFCHRMPEPTEIKLTLSVAGSQLQFYVVRARYKDIMERENAGLYASPQGKPPMGLVSERKATCVIYKGHSQM